MDLIAYALRQEFAGTVTQTIDGELVEVPLYSGGLIRAGDELDINVLDELELGGGLIVIDERDQAAAVQLDAYPPLERVKVPAGAEPTGAFSAAEPYADQPVADLKADLERRGVTGTGRKDELVAALEEYDLRLAEDTLVEPLTVKDLVEAAANRLAEAATPPGLPPVPPSDENTPPAGGGANDQAGQPGEEG